jgi:hypothetical protein
MLESGHGDGHDAVNITDGAWMDVIQMASKYGYSAPGLVLQREGSQVISEDDAYYLGDALDRALKAGDIKSRISDADVLDGDLARRIVYILQRGIRDHRDVRRDVRLIRTLPWK